MNGQRLASKGYVVVPDVLGDVQCDLISGCLMLRITLYIPPRLLPIAQCYSCEISGRVLPPC